MKTHSILRACAFWLTLMCVPLAGHAQSAVTWPWSQLTVDQKQILAPFEGQWNSWSVNEKRSWVVLANRYPTLSAPKKARAAQRIREWAQLSGEQRTTARSNIRLSRERKRDERAAEWDRYQRMTAEQKRILRKSQQAGTAQRGSRSGLAPGAAQPLGIRRSGN